MTGFLVVLFVFVSVQVRKKNAFRVPKQLTYLGHVVSIVKRGNKTKQNKQKTVFKTDVMIATFFHFFFKCRSELVLDSRCSPQPIKACIHINIFTYFLLIINIFTLKSYNFQSKRFF